METFQTTREHEAVGALRCATLKCAWFDTDSTWKPLYGTPFTVRCERCGRERRGALDSGGNLIGRWHYYPSKPKLSYAKGQRPSAADFRRMLLAQRLNETREARRLKETLS